MLAIRVQAGNSFSADESRAGAQRIPGRGSGARGTWRPPAGLTPGCQAGRRRRARTHFPDGRHAAPHGPAAIRPRGGTAGPRFDLPGAGQARSSLRCSTAFSRRPAGTGPGGITRKTAMRRAGSRGRRRVRGELIAGEHPGYARPPHRGPAVSDQRRRLHRGRRGRPPGRCLPRVLRPLAGRARQDPGHRRHRGPGGPWRGRRVHRRGPGRPAAHQAVGRCSTRR